MKTKIYVILGTGLLLSGLAIAKDGLDKRPLHLRSLSLVEKFDSNGDGKLSEVEREMAKRAHKELMEARKKAMIKKFDADASGDLNHLEQKTMKETLRKEMLERFDTDKDGKLSSEEKVALRSKMGREHHAKGEKPQAETEAPGEGL